MPTTPLHGVPYPAGDLDPDNVPADLAAGLIALERYTLVEFPTTAARDAWFADVAGANGVEGPYAAVITTGTRKITVRVGGAWRTIWSDSTKVTPTLSSDIADHSMRLIHNEAARTVHLDGWVAKSANGGFVAAATRIAVLSPTYAHTSAATFRWMVPATATDGSLTYATVRLNGNYGDDANSLYVEPVPGAPKAPSRVWLDSIYYSTV